MSLYWICWQFSKKLIFVFILTLGLLPEIVATDCARCSPEQVNLARSLVQYIQQNRMDEYRLLQNLYDPKVKYILVKFDITIYKQWPSGKVTSIQNFKYFRRNRDETEWKDDFKVIHVSCKFSLNMNCSK